MPAYVGAVSCAFVKGPIDYKSQRVEVWELAGVDGVGAQVLGLGHGEFEITATAFGVLGDLRTWSTALKALNGTVVSITTDHGETWTGCLLTEVGNMEIAAAAHAAGNGFLDRRGDVKIKGVVT